jgi:hypothetical protein
MGMSPAAVPARAPRWPAWLAWALWALVMLAVVAVAWLDHLLRQAGRPELATTVGAVPPILAVLSTSTVGAVLASRRPRHPVGWLLLAAGLSLGENGVASLYAPYGLLVRPGALPAADYLAMSFPATAAVALALVGFVVLLTPTGSLPSPRWRWWARVAAAPPVVFVLAAALAPRPRESHYAVLDNPFDFHALRGALLVTHQVALAVINVAVLVAAGSLVARFRRARGVERQQLRWLAVAAVFVSLAVLVALVAVAIGSPFLTGWAAGACLAILPMAIGAAILRYRLYDLDRIVSRTLAYGLLTVLLGLCYAGIVLGLGPLLGRGSSLVVAAATLAVAALFQPARGRVQAAVDRRFDRRRYDAARTIEAFSTRLRDEVDLDTLTVELVAVVERTMQPTGVSLWLRPPAATADSRGTT